jgi:hypothetical protein
VMEHLPLVDDSRDEEEEEQGVLEMRALHRGRILAGWWQMYRTYVAAR